MASRFSYASMPGIVATMLEQLDARSSTSSTSD